MNSKRWPLLRRMASRLRSRLCRHGRTVEDSWDEVCPNRVVRHHDTRCAFCGVALSHREENG